TDPFMVAPVLMQHHPRQGCALAPLAMRSTLFRPLDQLALLEPQLHPRVATLAAGFAIPGVEVLRVPPQVPSAVAIGQRQHFIHRRPPPGYLTESLVDQALDPPILVPLHVSAEGPLADPEQPGCLILT